MTVKTGKIKLILVFSLIKQVTHKTKFKKNFKLKKKK